MLKNSTLIAASTAVSQGIVAILYIIVAREAGPSVLGNIVAVVAVATFMAGLMNFGTNNYWVREFSSGVMSVDLLSNLVFSKLAYTALASLAGTIVTAIFFSQQIYVATAILAFSITYNQTMLVPLKATSSGYRLSITVTLERIIAALAFTVLMVFEVRTQYSLVTALCIGAIASGAIARHLAPVRLRFMARSTRLVWPWHGSLSHGIGNVTLSAQVLDATILYAVAGPAATGVYGAVNRWTQPLSVFSSAFSTVGLPIVARTGSLRKSYPALKSSWWMLGAAATMCLLVAIFSPLIVGMLLGAQYKDSAVVLSVLALGTIPALVNQPLYVFLQALHAEVFTAIHVTVGVVLQLSLCAGLGYLYAELGVAVAFAVAQVYLICGFFCIIWRNSKRQYSDEREGAEDVSAPL